MEVLGRVVDAIAWGAFPAFLVLLVAVIIARVGLRRAHGRTRQFLIHVVEDLGNVSVTTAGVESASPDDAALAAGARAGSRSWR
jgi:hypothetical protein